jgi:hypothetical protein
METTHLKAEGLEEGRGVHPWATMQKLERKGVAERATGEVVENKVVILQAATWFDCKNEWEGVHPGAVCNDLKRKGLQILPLQLVLIQ